MDEAIKKQVCEAIQERVQSLVARERKTLEIETANEVVLHLRSELNEEQTRWVDALRSLNLGGRATGRTHAVLVSLLEAAALRPGCWIPLADHCYPSVEPPRHWNIAFYAMRDLLKRVDPLCKFELSVTHQAVRAKV